jgi:ubiquitin carboxyl-terminal hydrolase 34
LDHYIYQAIRYGIRKGASLPPCAPFLRAALTYCEHSESTNGIAKIIEHTASIARHLDNPEGKEYLQFFKDAFEISSNHHGTSREDIFLFCLQQLPIWVPGLLTYYDAIVRTDTEDFVQEIIFRHGPDADFGSSPDGVKKTEAVLTAARKLGIACLSYLHDTYVRQRQQAVRATLLSIQTVIEACAGYYDEESDEEADSRFREMRSSFYPL